MFSCDIMIYDLNLMIIWACQFLMMRSFNQYGTRRWEKLLRLPNHLMYLSWKHKRKKIKVWFDLSCCKSRSLKNDTKNNSPTKTQLILAMLDFVRFL